MNPLEPLARLALIVLLSLYSLQAKSQNLVPNGGFEEGVDCPLLIGDLHDRCSQWYRSIEIPGLEDWEQPSPDWFHECSEQDLLTPPETVFGFKSDYGGEGFAAIGISDYPIANYREIIGCELLSPLQPDEFYNVSFRVSRISGPQNTLASDGLGVKFTTFSNFTTNNSAINNSSHFEIDTIISDTTVWLDVSFNFLADSMYSYMHIGNFNDKWNTAYLGLTDTLGFDGSLYSIDDVSIEPSPLSHREANDLYLILAHPNPVSDFLNVQTSLLEAFSLFLVDINGVTIFSKDYHQSHSNVRLNLSGISSGIYILKIVSSKSIFYETIIKI
jgi:hypothetical protein